MGWCMTSDLDRFQAVAGGYLRARAAENTLLLSAAQNAQNARNGPAAGGPGLLFGWWEPPDGSGPRAAFLHDQAAPLLVAGRAPETAAALAAALSRTGRGICGVDAPAGVADAFAAAWSQRAGVGVQVHSRSRVYRLAGPVSYQMGPAGRYRVATAADRPLLVRWLTAFGVEVGELAGAPEAAADDLIGYGGAAFWEAHGRPVAMATTTRPVEGTVRLSIVYTPPGQRHTGYATAVMLAASRAALAGAGAGGDEGSEAGDGRGGPISEVVLITDTGSPDRQASRLGYQLIGERAVLRFGPPTGPMPRVQTGPMVRATTGPLPRIRG
jgi:hypothetical protein